MNRRKWIYIGILIVVAAIVSIASFSYAFLTRVDEQHGKINIVAGTLDYKIESDDLENNTITLSANESKEIEITIKSLNKINSKYQLYTNNVENVDIRYTDEEEPGVGTISSNGTKIVKVVLENNSDTDKTITFGVQGGFEDKTLTLEDNRVAVVLGERLCDVEPGTVYNFAYTGGVQEFIAKCSGNYRIEAWGAQGGSSCYSYNLNSGAYTSGVINLEKNTNLKVYVGQSTNTQGSTVFNGGGVGFASSYSTSYAATGAYSGGGATDIRYGGTTLNNRVMVAAGGGGRGTSGGTLDCSNPMYQGGAGGGLKGYGSMDDTSYGMGSYGGTQTSGGTCIYSEYCEPGLFGQGGSSIANSHSNGGAGGGYYGGAADRSEYKKGTSGLRGGGGGSSFISGHAGCVAIQSSSSTSVKTGCSSLTDSNKLECSKHYSGLYFTNTKMIDGYGYTWTDVVGAQEQMPKPNGEYYPLGKGNAGSGYARITYLGSPKTITFNSMGGEVTETTRKVFYGYEIGELPTPTKSGKIFDGWYLDSNFTTKVDSTYIVENDITLYARYGTEVALNLGTRTQGYPSNTTLDGTTFRNYNMNTYVVGLSVNNYYSPSRIYDYQITSDSYYVKQLSGYGIGLPMQLSPGDYKITATITSGQFSVIKYSSNAFDSYDVSVRSTDTISKVFNIADNITHEVLLFTGIYIDASTPTEITATNIHLYKLD